MAKIILVCLLGSFLIALSQTQDVADRACGPFETYYRVGKCAPCGADCAGGKIPCPRGSPCRTGCQCIPGWEKVNGRCVDRRSCGNVGAHPPPGPVN